MQWQPGKGFEIRVPFHLSFRSSFLSTMYTSLGANSPPNSFNEMAPSANEIIFGMNHAPGAGLIIIIRPVDLQSVQYTTTAPI